MRAEDNALDHPEGEEMDTFRNHPVVKAVGLNRVMLACILIVMYLSFAWISPWFFSWTRILSALNYVYFLGFLSLGVTFVIATGGIDFSIGPVMFCCALISGYCLTSFGFPMIPAMLTSLLVGLCFGTFNGYLAAYWNIPPFIVSMASMNIARGLASVFTRSQSVSWPRTASADGWYRRLIRVGNFPTGLVIFLGTAVLCAVLLHKTRPGRYILHVGSNKEAARLSGINVKKWQMSAYMICGLLVGIAALFYVAAYTTVQPGYGDQYNNEAIAGCVMGGTSMAGGIASVGGTVIGVLIIDLLQEGILSMGMNKNYQLIITGLIVIAAVFFDAFGRKRKGS